MVQVANRSLTYLCVRTIITYTHVQVWLINRVWYVMLGRDEQGGSFELNEQA